MEFQVVAKSENRQNRGAVLINPVKTQCKVIVSSELTQYNVGKMQYKAVANRGAMLFFLLNSLSKIHAFYQYSLNSFVSVFSRAIDLAPGT